jgi:hypothetical protein
MSTSQAEFPMTTGYRVLYGVLGVVLCLTVIGIPFGILFIATACTAKACFTREGMEAVYWPAGFSRKMHFATARRVGVYFSSARASLMLCWQDDTGKTTEIMLSVYQNAEEMMKRVSRGTGLRLEALEPGWFSAAWPATLPRRMVA